MINSFMVNAIHIYVIIQGNLKLEGRELPTKEYSKYLGSIIENNGDIEQNILHIITSG